jgi:hypothetical protein
MATYTISCLLGTNNTNAGIGFEAWLDDTQLTNIEAIDIATTELSWEVEEDEAEHELRFVMKNKNIDHTTVDETNNILSDVLITLDNIALDDVPLGHLFTQLSEYRHDFNGNGPATVGKFYGTMGCNGTLSFKFENPLHLWLLENL